MCLFIFFMILVTNGCLLYNFNYMLFIDVYDFVIYYITDKKVRYLLKKIFFLIYFHKV